MAFPVVVTERDRARGQRAVWREAAVDHAAEALAALFLLGALGLAHPVAWLLHLVRP